MDKNKKGRLATTLDAMLRSLKASEGFSIKDLPKGKLFKVRTLSNSEYVFVVLDPETNEVAMTGSRPGYEEPQLARINGATSGGSMIMLNWVKVNFWLEIRLYSGKTLTISPIQFISLSQDKNLAQEMIEKAEKNRPPPVTQKQLDDVNSKIFSDVKTKFPADRQEIVEDLLNFFCLQGRGIMMSLLVAANDIGKLDDAIVIIKKQIGEHWGWKAPEIRGAIIIPSDHLYIRKAYEKLGIQLPS